MKLYLIIPEKRQTEINVSLMNSLYEIVFDYPREKTNGNKRFYYKTGLIIPLFKLGKNW